ncbi:unnamed protein product [Rodentolepis nana]|uniref:Uncharacterized protein n=1 Tax=Rodentolepis nana TaxID=102285 RepID=A0A0R3T1E3_RODNA|nr:unnamed protein product [Rodentolepis nana]
MISDVRSAEDLNNGLQKYLVDLHIFLLIRINCYVLDASYWPLEVGTSTISCNHTASLKNSRRHFDLNERPIKMKQNL